MPDQIRSIVSKYANDDKELKGHVHDLRYTAFKTYNATVEWLRKGCGTKKFCFIDEVLKWSEVITESTLTRVKIGNLDEQKRCLLVHFYYEEGAEYTHNYRLPNKIKDFKKLGWKSDRVKEAVLTILCEVASMRNSDGIETLASDRVVQAPQGLDLY